MFRHAFAAAVRHLARTRLQAAIAVGGLAVGLTAAMLAALILRSEYGFDRDIPGHERLYVIIGAFSPPGLAPQYAQITAPDFAERLRATSAEIEASATTFYARTRVSLGTRVEREPILWVDANFGELWPMRSLAGDADAALANPDAVVLSRSAARRWFGEDAPLGRTLRVNDRPVTVRAVIADPPGKATHVERHFLLSTAASDSPPRQDAANGRPPADFIGTGATYLRLRPGARPEALHPLLPDLVATRKGGASQVKLELVRIDRLHTHEGLNRGFGQRMRVLTILGLVVFGIAAVNFVALQTARGASRAREVAIRKLAGARRSTLVAQFLGEAVAWSLIGTLLAIALTELLLPHVNAFLDTSARFDYATDGGTLLAVLLVAIALGALAGAWPAVILAQLRPIGVLRGSPGGRRDGTPRRVLVSLQFAALIALAIGAGVAHRQREYAVRESLRVDTHRLAILRTENRAAFIDAVRGLPGVTAATRATLPLFGSAGFRGGNSIGVGRFHDRDGNEVAITGIQADFDLFDFLGVRPLAGRLPDASRSSASVPREHYAVINETALRQLGLGTPEQALEQRLPIAERGFSGGADLPLETRVLAVVPDFTFDTIATPVQPMVYTPVTDYSSLLLVRLDGQRIGETFAGIDAAWKRTGGFEPPVRSPLDEVLQERYIGIERQSQALGLCALIAVLLACVGLYGLTAAAAQRRTREIGVRKALGAQNAAVVRLLLWQFTRPVLWGTLIAWVAAAWLMQRWLQAFAHHADLPLWLFPAASMAAIAIALMTVAGHAWAMARTQPARALRVD